MPLDEIPDVLIKATLATEDRRFFEHYGIDVFGTLRALMTNVQANEVVQGGSTLTQQLAKNLFLSSERSLQRKIKEVFLAFLLESRYSKREILKLYFDRAYMGGGAFGVEAASQYYFGKSVRDINMAEAAMLAGLFKAPTKFSPLVDLAASRARTNQVLDNLVDAGYYTAAQVHAARMNPARIVENRSTTSPDWFLDWAFEEVQRIADGKGQYVLTARTTVDLTLQRQAEEALNAALKREGVADHFNSGAIVVMETDGKVRAIVGGPDYGESQFNRATHAKRQPGSSFKVYVYATAMENGYTPDTIVRDASRSCGNWSPSNYGGGGGSGARMPLWEALAKSLNTVAAELSFAVGREKVIEMTQAARHRRRQEDLLDGARRRRHHRARAHRRLRDLRQRRQALAALRHSRHHHLEGRPPLLARARRAAGAAGALAARRRGNEHDAQSRRDRRHRPAWPNLDFTNVAGKTGTSTGPKDAWFIGFTGKYVAGVWIGNDDNHPMRAGVTGGHHGGADLARPDDGRAYRHEHSDHPRPRAASAPDRRAAAPRRTEGAAGRSRDSNRRRPSNRPTRRRSPKASCPTGRVAR